eukprot:6183544-Pleurochrysis_carterae.AAC.1
MESAAAPGSVASSSSSSGRVLGPGVTSSDGPFSRSFSLVLTMTMYLSMLGLSELSSGGYDSTRSGNTVSLKTTCASW